ncbi:MAG: hypothetical protein ACR2PX_21395 [Endozoicomonas sp.]|uniref:hypothetical protein n=1 Tax=Endozoicomonas sp. TaxID=1892382 RepID=UPI003D9AB938
MKKNGRPPFKVTTDVRLRAKQLALEGCSKKQIAQGLGIGYSTLMKKQLEHKALGWAMAKGRQEMLSSTLEEKNQLFEFSRHGDVRSQILFLVQRCPESWSFDGQHEYRQLIKQKQLEKLMAKHPVLVLESAKIKVLLFVIHLKNSAVLVKCCQ